MRASERERERERRVSIERQIETDRERREGGGEDGNCEEPKQASESDSVMTQISELPDMKFNVTMTNMLRAQM